MNLSRPRKSAGSGHSQSSLLAPVSSAPATPPALSLPPELLALVFSKLHASDVGRAATACKPWHHTASHEAAAWTQAIAELDPFCALGGAEGAWRLFHGTGGSWLRVAYVLTSCRAERCDKCNGGSSSTAAGAGSRARGSVLCQCVSRTTRAAAAAAAAAASSSGYRLCCSKHCSGSPGCVPLKPLGLSSRPMPLGLWSRWMFHAQEPISRGAVISGDGTLRSGSALQLALYLARPFSTIKISGRFRYSTDSMLHIFNPVRVVGDGTASLVTEQGCVFVLAPLVMLQHLHVEMEVQELEPGSESDGYECYERTQYSPALQVDGSACLIAHKLSANSQHGTAVMLDDGASAFLQDCTLSSQHPEWGAQCLGLVAKHNTTLSMYSCVVRDAWCGADAGQQGALLSEHNTFTVFDEGTPNLYDYQGHVVQPWRTALDRQIKQVEGGGRQLP